MGSKKEKKEGRRHKHKSATDVDYGDDYGDVELDNLAAANNDDGVAATPSATGRHYLRTMARAKIGRVSAGAIFLVLACLASGLAAVVMIASRSGKSDPAWVNMRWHDGGDCMPHYRMADAPIHCGNDNGPLNVSSDGKQFCGGVIMEPNYCTLPTAGTWEASPEASTPPPLPRRFGVDKHHTPIPLCETMAELIAGNYKGEQNNQEWIPKSCSAVPLSPFVWTKNTKCQATISMIGDGHVRNLFTATVHGLRGVESFVEAHENKEAKARGIAESYFWKLHRDGTASDRFADHVDTLMANADLFEDCPCDEVQKCLRVAFIWAPTFIDQLKQLHVVTKEKSDIVIVSPGNAAEPTDLLPSYWVAAYEQLLNEYEFLQLGVVHYPFGIQPEGREAALAEWTNNATHAGRMSLLNQHEMKHVPTNSKNMTKYACGLGMMDVENDNIIATKPCTDLTDTAHMRALITLHLDALVGH